MKTRGWGISLCCALAVLALSGCKTTSADGMKQSFNDLFSGKYWEKETKIAAAPGGCPQVKMVEDLRKLSEFTDMSNPTRDTMMSSVDFVSLDSTCEYDADKDLATVHLMMEFDSRLGPKGRARTGDKPSFVYPYFVAVTTPEGEIMGKEVYAVATSYDSTQTGQVITESLKKIIPLDGASAGSYQLLIGFQLSEEQLAYNRQHPGEAPVTQDFAAAADRAGRIEPAAGAATAVPTAKPKVNVIEQKVVVKPVSVAVPEPAPNKANKPASPSSAPDDEAAADEDIIDITEPASR